MPQPKSQKRAGPRSKKGEALPSETHAKTDRLIDYDVLAPISAASNLLEVVPTHFAAHSTGPLKHYEGALRHEINFRGIPILESFIEHNTVLASVEFKYEAFGQNELKSVCTVHGAFMVLYSFPQDKLKASRELVELFAELHGMYHAWPFIRELVGSLVSRLGLSGVFLPVWPPPKRLPTKGQFVTVSF